MNTKQFITLREEFPDAMRVWHDRMHDLNKGQLIETLIVHMDMAFLHGLLQNIERDIAESRAEEGVANDD